MGSPLPCVPNAAGLLHWIFEPGRWLSDAPELLVPPPPRLLPPLSDLDDAERLERLHYWGSVLLVSPLLMACMCEILRLAFRLAKLHVYSSFKPIPQDDLELRILSMAPGNGEEQSVGASFCFQVGFALYHVVCAGLVVLAMMNSWLSPRGGGAFAWELWALWQQFCLWALLLQTFLRCCMEDADALRASTVKAVLLYTVPCISDRFDTMKDWVITGLCLLEPQKSWGLALGAVLIFVEAAFLLVGRFPRCVPLNDVVSISLPMVPLQALYAALTVALVVGPGFVRLAVTFYANARFALYTFVVLPALILFYTVCSILALVLVALQGLACLITILGMAVFDIPVALLSIFKSGLFWSVLASEHRCLGTYCNMEWYTPGTWFNETRTSLHSQSLTSTDVDGMSRDESQHEESWMHVAYLDLADGGLLCAVSLYVIIYSYLQVLKHEDCARDLRKSWCAILELRSPGGYLMPESCGDRIRRALGNLWVDFLNSSRLLIAWTRDWPQVIICLVLIRRHMLLHDSALFGVAGVSAIISLFKGLLIPSFQASLCQWQRARASSALDALISSEGLRELSQTLEQSKASRIRRRNLELMLQSHIRKASRQTLLSLNVTERECFRPILSESDDWLSSCLPEERVAEVATNLVAAYVERGTSSEELFRLGYAPLEVLLGCKLLGYSCSDCRDAGAATNTVLCKDAGFTCSDCKEAGFTVNQLRTGGYSCRECRESGLLTTVAHCQAVGFSLEDCRDARYTAEDCRDAGSTAAQCRQAGFTTRECLEGGYSARECQDAGFKDVERWQQL